MNSAHDLDTWRLFFQVVNLGSVSKAAQSLHQETSAISRKLNKLEKDLGTELFTKDGRKLKLTSAGFVAFSRMRRIVLDVGVPNQRSRPKAEITLNNLLLLLHQLGSVKSFCPSAYWSTHED